MIGEDWKGFNAACYKKENQVENIGLPKVGVKLPDVALSLILSLILNLIVKSEHWVASGWVWFGGALLLH